MDLDEVFRLWSVLVAYADQYLHILLPAVGGSIVLAFLVWILYRLNDEQPDRSNVVVLEERRMTKEERTAYVKRTVADAVCDALERAVDNGKLTPDEVTVYYERIGQRCGLKDLLPGGVLRSSMLKRQIKHRLINGDRTPVNIPEGKETIKREPRNRLEAIFLRNAS